MSAKNEVPIILHGKKIRITIPDGFYRVLSGVTKPTDLFYSKKAEEKNGNPWMRFADTEFCRGGGADVAHCLCVIRRGKPVDTPCVRCEQAAVGEMGFLVELCDACFAVSQKTR